jgi:hypothetical protein
MMKCFLVLFLTLSVAQAFVVSRQTAGSFTSLSMAPKYDKRTEKWSPSKPEEGPEAGYPPTKTLLLHGPKPYLQRIFTPDDYEQAVLKFMSGDKCSRDVAQGNMDAYLRSKFARRSNRTRAVEQSSCLPVLVHTGSLTHLRFLLFAQTPEIGPTTAWMKKERASRRITYLLTKIKLLSPPCGQSLWLPLLRAWYMR